MPLSKKYYEKIVKLICSCNCPKASKDNFIDYLKEDNKNFSEQKFRNALKKCEVKK